MEERTKDSIEKLSFGTVAWNTTMSTFLSQEEARRNWEELGPNVTRDIPSFKK